MRISVADAEGQLSELIRLANQGEEIVLMEDGRTVAQLQPLKNPLSPEEKSRIMTELQEQVRLKNLPPAPEAARSQDFLYDDFGMPR